MKKQKIIKKKKKSDAERILLAERKILLEEKKLEKLERQLSRKMRSQPRIALFSKPSGRNVTLFHNFLLRKLIRHRFLYALLVGIGVVFVWRGIWHYSETLPIISHPAVTIILGLAILWITQRYTRLS